MQRFEINCLKKSVLLFFVTLLTISSYGQQPVPTQEQINEILPNSIDPTQMTKSGFDNYFKDNNQRKNTGNYKNK